MKYMTVGVIGHVDHGKTTLVKGLTGVDTDRLKEEKERGISIALGFAHLDLPDGEIGFIDAPGHEKFVRTMIAGATGSAAVMLLVDVNEGVKPQTVEHLDIAQLLGVQRGIVAITKCDTADADMRELAEADLEDLLEGTFLAGAPVLHVSAQSGEGLDELKQALNDILHDSEQPKEEGFTYLPVDRAFSMSGFGTVVTGTLRRGALNVGDDVEVYTQGLRAKVRGLESHSAQLETVTPGHRTAVNLRGVEKLQIGRGDVVATPGTLSTGAFLDVQCHLLDHADGPLKQRQVVRILFGTTETFGRAHLLDRDELVPGETTVLQFQLDDPSAVLNREPFIVRLYSPMRTIGGGVILGTSDSRYKRHDVATIKRLEVHARGDLVEMVSLSLEENDTLSVPAFSRTHRFDPDDLRAFLNAVEAVGIDEEHVAGKQRADDARERILAAIEQHHKDEPTERGITGDILREGLDTPIDDKLFRFLLQSLESDERLECEQGLYRIAGYEPGSGLNAQERGIVDEIESAFRDATLEPPGVVDVLHNDKDRMRLYRFLVDSGTLVSTFVANKPRTLSNVVVFHKDALDDAKRRLTDEFAQSGQFETSEAKAHLGISRKYLIPLLECLDATGFTRRSENHRVFIEK